MSDDLNSDTIKLTGMNEGPFNGYLVEECNKSCLLTLTTNSGGVTLKRVRSLDGPSLCRLSLLCDSSFEYDYQVVIKAFCELLDHLILLLKYFEKEPVIILAIGPIIEIVKRLLSSIKEDQRGNLAAPSASVKTLYNCLVDQFLRNNTIVALDSCGVEITEATRNDLLYIGVKQFNRCLCTKQLRFIKQISFKC